MYWCEMSSLSNAVVFSILPCLLFLKISVLSHTMISENRVVDYVNTRIGWYGIQLRASTQVIDYLEIYKHWLQFNDFRNAITWVFKALIDGNLYRHFIWRQFFEWDVVCNYSWTLGCLALSLHSKHTLSFFQFRNKVYIHLFTTCRNHSIDLATILLVSVG